MSELFKAFVKGFMGIWTEWLKVIGRNILILIAVALIFFLIGRFG